MHTQTHRYRHLPFVALLALSSQLIAAPTYAATITVSPSDDIQSILDNATKEDEIIFSKGLYVGHFTIDKPLTLTGSKDTTINAQGKGNAFTIASHDVVLQQFNIINWGDDLTEQNAAIYIDSKSKNITIKGNKMSGRSFGIWAEASSDLDIHNNRIIGDTSLRSADRGNGIQLSAITKSTVSNNTISEVRDGIYIISSQDNIIIKNHVSNLRYGIHYMYSYSNDVLNNEAFNTRAGYALMSSRYLTIKGNQSTDSEDYGFLMNFITQSTIEDNSVDTVWTKPEDKVTGREGKGFFVYNSAYNTFSRNQVKHAEIGIHLTAGSEGNKIFANRFIDNPQQVKYVSNRSSDWSEDGVGNYWSHYLGWDLNSDNIGDTAYEPNDGVDKMLWQYPEAKLLMDSPSVLSLRWMQRQFPVLKPLGMKDSAPLMPTNPLVSQYLPKNQD